MNAINEWLIEHGATVSDDTLITTLARLLNDAGLPVDRLWIGRRTHHPLVVALSLEWTPSGTRTNTLPFARRDVMQRGPFAAFSDGQIHRLLMDATPRGAFGLPEQLWDDYHSVLVVARSTASNSLAGFIATLATSAPAGFPATTEAILEAIFPTLDVVLLARGGLEFARSIATTYLGREVGARVYDGMIHRGEGETIRAAIWLSDLRGFSRLSEEHPLPVLLQLLDDAFEAQVGAIEGVGGEVLKFMGDGLLAVFRAKDGDDGQAACAAALAAAADAAARIAALRERRAATGEPAVDHGVALHFGDVMFGNIGAPHRLDFTVIGPAVNLAARLEARCAPLGVRLVMSEAFAERCAARTREAERVVLKGVGEQAVYVLADDPV